MLCKFMFKNLLTLFKIKFKFYDNHIRKGKYKDYSESYG